jgi:hypothetical protein
MSLIGSEGFVRDRVAAMKESGVTTLNIAPFEATHEDRVKLIEQIKEIAAS